MIPSDDRGLVRARLRSFALVRAPARARSRCLFRHVGKARATIRVAKTAAIRLLVGLGLPATLLHCSTSTTTGDQPDPSSFPTDPAQTVPSGSGVLALAVRTSPQPPVLGLDDAQFTITRADDGSPVDGLTITVTPWMPAMNHGTSIVPTVTAQGGGRYLVTNLDLYMEGYWQLRTSIAGPAPGSSSSADAGLSVEGTAPSGDGAPVDAEAGTGDESSASDALSAPSASDGPAGNQASAESGVPAPAAVGPAGSASIGVLTDAAVPTVGISASDGGTFTDNAMPEFNIL